MKTLDEVIHALEVCTSSYCSNHDGDCPYLGHYKCNEEQRKLDALHYLKEYRTTQTAYVKAMADYEELKNFWAESQANPPLTWDELKTMEGKPVWVQWTVKGEWHHGDWNLVHAQLDDRIWFADGNGEIYDLPQDQQGIFWQAFRKERE